MNDHTTLDAATFASINAEPSGALGGTHAQKLRYTVHLTSELVERLRDAVYWTPGLTLAELAEDALRGAIDRLEKTRGQPFPRRAGKLKGGRPIGS
ncbi:MAG: hypothetical protein JNM07_03725 [Phycisphaerae bacterium]|nr:hypothetical protein [Phycisphaerae bacterium]